MFMKEFTQPSIYFGNLRIDEPVTTLTDLVVSALCFLFFYKLSKMHINNKTSFYLRYYFLSMGIATAIGGIVGHGFLYVFNYNTGLPVSPWKLPGWLTSMFSVALVERAAIEYARPLIKPKVGHFFAWINIVELITFITITFITLNFFYVEVHTAYGFLVVVSSFSTYVLIKTKSKGSKLFLIAVGFSALSALFFMNKWGISPWFNHFDISHTIMCISAYFFFRGSIAVLKETKRKKN